MVSAIAIVLIDLAVVVKCRMIVLIRLGLAIVKPLMIVEQTMRITNLCLELVDRGGAGRRKRIVFVSEGGGSIASASAVVGMGMGMGMGMGTGMGMGMGMGI